MARVSKSSDLPFARLLMVLSGLSPLFILWAIRGLSPLSDRYWVPFCAAMVVVPNLGLFIRLRVAIKQNDVRTMRIGEPEDNRDHLLGYLFAMVLPLFDLNVSQPRDVVGLVVALTFVVFLFWHLHLHYMNLFFALFGYRVFTVYPSEAENTSGGGHPFVLLTKRSALKSGVDVLAVRVSNTVYWER